MGKFPSTEDRKLELMSFLEVLILDPEPAGITFWDFNIFQYPW
jgi:hypothetical protein